MIRKIVYGLVGIAAVYSIVLFAMDIATLTGMPILVIIATILLLIGGINWGIVAIADKDLLELIGL